MLAGVSKISISDQYLICGIRTFPSLKREEHIIEFKNFNEDSFLCDIALSEMACISGKINLLKLLKHMHRLKPAKLG